MNIKISKLWEFLLEMALKEKSLAIKLFWGLNVESGNSIVQVGQIYNDMKKLLIKAIDQQIGFENLI